ncbi:MAG: NIPSNAP family protein [Chloroflexota bacterium]
MSQIVEIRSYNLKPGTRAAYHQVVVDEAVPMLRRWKMDVVAFGASPHDENTYYLMRAFADVDDLNRQEDAFYGSEEWRTGPREAILSRIENYTSIVIEVDDATLAGLRR